MARARNKKNRRFLAPCTSLAHFDEPFLRMVMRRFPPSSHPRVADVAGAGGYMAIPLMRAGYRVTVIDPQVNKLQGHPGVRFPRFPRSIERVPRKFLVRDAFDFDLLVGFWPCGASKKLVRAAKHRPLAFHPCGCSHVWPGNSSSIREILSQFRAHGVRVGRDGRTFWTR